MLTATKSFPAASVATDPASGISYTSYYDIFTIGAGYLDVWAALNNNQLATGSAASPTAVLNSSTGVVTLADTNALYSTGESTIWNSSDARNLAAVWGSSVLVPDSSSTTSSGSTTVWEVQRSGAAQRFGAAPRFGVAPPYGAARRSGAAQRSGVRAECFREKTSAGAETPNLIRDI